MAIDTAAKRIAAFGSGRVFPLVTPEPDGTISAEDRAVLLACYIPLTYSFDDAAIDTVRWAKARVTIEWGGSVLDALEITSGAQNSLYSRVPGLIGQVADRNSVIPRKWFTMDSRTRVDQMYMAPSTLTSAASNQVGWWGDAFSDGAGNFSVAQDISIRFPASPLNSLSVVGDAAYAEYPVDFVVRVYSGAALRHTETVTGNAAVSWSTTITSIPDATRTTLQVTKWSAINTCLKIAEFFTSVTEVYDGDEIMSISVLEEMEVKDATIPTGNISANQLELSLNNVDDKFFPGNIAAEYHAAVRNGRKIVVEMGFDVAGLGVEYKPFGTYWSGDWRVAEASNVASTVAYDRMERLRKATIEPSEVYFNETVGELAERVLESAFALLPDLTYNIDSRLYESKYKIPVAWFERGGHFEVLRDLARASLGRVFCDRNDVIQVLGPIEFGAYSYEITADNYFDRVQPEETEDVANEITVTTQPLTAVTGEDLYSSSEYVMYGGQSRTFVFEFKDAPCINPSGALEAVENATEDVESDGLTDDAITFAGSISSATYTAWGGTATVACTTSGTFKINVTGTKYEVIGADVITREDSASIFEYGRNRYELKKNRFIQSPALAEEIAAGLLAAFKDPAKETQLNWRGNPSIGLETVIRAPEYVRGAVSTKADFATYKQKTTWDGTLKSMLYGMKLRETVNTIMQDTDGSAATFVVQDTDNATPTYIIQG